MACVHEKLSHCSNIRVRLALNGVSSVMSSASINTPAKKQHLYDSPYQYVWVVIWAGPSTNWTIFATEQHPV